MMRLLKSTLLATVFLCLFSAICGGVGPEHVLVLVNENSPTSRYIAKLYREYHPEITDTKFLYLSGLVDCSGPNSTPADEIITREQYNVLIAEPVRIYLYYLNSLGNPDQIRLLITTAGMPYRIKDTNSAYSNAVYPAGSNPLTIGNNESQIDAASVESELTCVMHGDFGDNPFGITNRMVNPYQGCRSGFELFTKSEENVDSNLRWTIGVSLVPGVDSPKMEGNLYWFGPRNRIFCPANIFLTARLDGPKRCGESAIYIVRQMLERARRASHPLWGVNPAQGWVVFDDAPTLGSDLDYNRVFNLNTGNSYWLKAADSSSPPDAIKACLRNDYVKGFIALSNAEPYSGMLNIAPMGLANNLCVALDYRNYTRTSQNDLSSYAAEHPQRRGNQGIVGLACFGVNGDEGSSSHYLQTDGPEGTELFNVLNGAVFTSLESFNAVTMFSDVATLPSAQGKIINFITLGGTGAIGHSFEPQTDAAIDNEFLFYNLFADADGDGEADLTFIEAAFSAIPYLSWGEVVIGDPLMRITYGPGSRTSWKSLEGDVNRDGIVNLLDVSLIESLSGAELFSTDPATFEAYNDLADTNRDGIIDYEDLYPLMDNFLEQEP
jgi:hypothetical protein